jgi:hypothetical protein
MGYQQCYLSWPGCRAFARHFQRATNPATPHISASAREALQLAAALLWFAKEDGLTLKPVFR